jgi:hypothetical protein
MMNAARARCATLLGVIIGEDHSLIRDPIYVGRSITHQAFREDAKIRLSDIIAPDYENIRLVVSWLCHNCPPFVYLGHLLQFCHQAFTDFRFRSSLLSTLDHYGAPARGSVPTLRLRPTRSFILSFTKVPVTGGEQSLGIDTMRTSTSAFCLRREICAIAKRCRTVQTSAQDFQLRCLTASRAFFCVSSRSSISL